MHGNHRVPTLLQAGGRVPLVDLAWSVRSPEVRRFYTYQFTDRSSKNAATILVPAVERAEPAGASPSAGHWRFGTRLRPRLARSCSRSRAALRRAQLDEFLQARSPMPGRWKRRRVQT